MSKAGKTIKTIFALIGGTAIVGGAVIGTGCAISKDFKERVQTVFNVVSDEQVEKDKNDVTNNTDSDYILDLETQLTNKDATISQLRTQLEELRAQDQAEIDELESEVLNLENELIIKTSELTLIQTELAEKISLVESLTAEKVQLENRILEIEQELENLKNSSGNIDELNERILELESEKQQLTSELQGKTDELTVKMQELIDAQAQIATLTADKVLLESQLAEKQATIETLTNEVVLLEAQLREYEESSGGSGLDIYGELILAGSVKKVETVPGYIFVSSATATVPGLFVINKTDYSISKILDVGNSYNAIVDVGDNEVVIVSQQGVNHPGGAHLYNLETKEVDVLLDTATTFDSGYYLEKENIVILSARDQYDHAYMINLDTRDATVIAQESNKHAVFSALQFFDAGDGQYYVYTTSGRYCKLDLQTSSTSEYKSFKSTWIQTDSGNILRMGANTTYKGLSFYDYSTKEWTELDANLYNYTLAYNAGNGKVVFGSASQSIKQLLIIDEATKSVQTITINGYNYLEAVKVSNGLVLRGTTYIAYLNTNTNQLIEYNNSNSISSWIVHEFSTGDIIVFTYDYSNMYHYYLTSGATSFVKLSSYYSDLIFDIDGTHYFLGASKDAKLKYSYYVTGGNSPTTIHTGCIMDLFYKTSNGSALLYSSQAESNADYKTSIICLYNSTTQSFTKLQIENQFYDDVSEDGSGIYLMKDGVKVVYISYATSAVTYL